MSHCQCGTRVGLPHLPQSVPRQKQTRPRFFRACRTAAVDARRCRRTSQRTAIPRAKLGKVQRCRCGQVPEAALLASSRDVEGVADLRYAKRPYAALYAIGPLILLPIPSSPHCTLKVSEHDSLWQPPAAHAYERPRPQKVSRAQRCLNVLAPGYFQGHGCTLSSCGLISCAAPR